MTAPTTPTDDLPELTLFLCGKVRCDHDYSAWGSIFEGERIVGETAICVKCGASAYEESLWD